MSFLYLKQNRLALDNSGNFKAPGPACRRLLQRQRPSFPGFTVHTSAKNTRKGTKNFFPFAFTLTLNRNI